MECCHIKELNIEHTIIMSSDQIYIHVLDDSLQPTDDQGDSIFIQSTKSCALEDLLTLLLHLQTKKHLINKF